MSDMKGASKGHTQHQPVSRTMEYYKQIQAGGGYTSNGHPEHTGHQSENMGHMGAGDDTMKVAKKHKYKAGQSVNKAKSGAKGKTARIVTKVSKGPKKV